MSDTTQRHVPAGLAILGGGNMGQAFVAGVLAAGLVSESDVCVLEIDAAKHATLRACGAMVTGSVADLRAWLDARPSACVIVAIKPQSFAELARDMRSACPIAGRLVVSIMAGVSIEAVSRELATPRVVRAMPNLPATLRAGATAYASAGACTSEDLSTCDAIVRSIGPVVLRVEESQLDLVTAVAGSGPAYIFLLAEAMLASARARGLPRDAAAALVRQTFSGAAALLAVDAREPGELQAAVTSRGGTTQAALEHFAAHNFHAIVDGAIAAAEARGRELGQPRA